jgi:subtilisin family serine protease
LREIKAAIQMHSALRFVALFGIIAACALAGGSVAAGDPGSATTDAFGDYIVVLKDSVDHPGAVAQAQTKQSEGDLAVVYRHALNGYAATLPADEIDTLRGDPRVAYVTADHTASILEEEVKLETEENKGIEISEATIPTGVGRIFANANKALSIDGKDNLRANVDVAVLDTGIDYEHPDLDVEARTSCITGTCIDNTGKDGHSHGTHVAGTIGAIDNGEGVVGVAPGARMWAVKVLNDGGSGAESWIIAGVDWVTAHAKEIEVANMSLGCPCSMPALDKAINGSVEAGVVYVVAAGNSNASASSATPASNPNVITVSALADYDGLAGGKSSSTCLNYGLDDQKASFSNYGSAVEIVAPGVCTLSTIPGNKYGYKSGTSMASPHVAGAAAILASLSNPNSKKDAETIRETLIKAGNKGWTDTSGDGIQEPLLDVSNEATFRLTGPPQVSTEPATSIKTTEATLNGTVNPSGVPTTYRFEYGKTTSYGTSVPVPNESAGSGTEAVAVSKTIKGLPLETTYHYRVVAESSEGTTYGTDRAFTTLAQSPINLYYFGGGLGTGNGQFEEAEGMATDTSGNVWVSDRVHNRVQKLTGEGKYLLQFGSEGSGNGQFKQPRGVATTSSGDLWVVDSGNDRVQKFNSKGEYLGQFGTSGSGSGQFNNPWGIAVAPDGSMWVSDTANDNVQKFTSSGTFILKSGSKGSGDGQFIDPKGIDTDSAGEVWVADSGNSRMQKLSSTGAFLTKLGSKGSGAGQFAEEGPLDVAVKPSGNLLVADGWNNHRVQQLSPDGQWLATISEWSPNPIAVGLGGKIFIYMGSARKVGVWSQPAKPEATTEPATSIKTTEATLKGIVNPSGAKTTYHFEYGKTTSYGTSIPVPNEKVITKNEEEETIEVFADAVAESKTIKGLTPETTYHFRVVAESSQGTTYGEDRTFTPGTPSALSGLAVAESFDGSPASITSFTNNWTALGWAGGGTPKGEVTATGWRPVAAYPTVNGAFYGSTLFDSGSGCGAVATMAVNPGSTSRNFAIWLDLNIEGEGRDGYVLRFTYTSVGTYSVSLERWVKGSQTVLGSKAGVGFANGNSLAIVDSGTSVSAWINTGGGFTQLLTASDSNFETGNPAIEGSGNVTRLTNFKAGAL